MSIPPIGIPFRIIGIISECAIFCRNSPSPDVGQIRLSDGVYPDQWFTLLVGIPGRYAIRSVVTGKVLYSRSKSPRVGQVEGDGEYEDNWFEIESQGGLDLFRLITPSEGLTLYSRLSPDPTFSNADKNIFYEDQLFRFILDGMQVDKVDFNLDAGVISSSKSVTLAEEVFTNNSDTEQVMTFSTNKGVTNSCTFEYGTGFAVDVGMEFGVGIPSIAEDRFTTETSATNTWTWGKTTEYNTQYTATFSVVVAPHTSVRVSCVVNQGALNVPFTMHLSGEGSGAKLETAGTLRGVSSWDLRHVVTTLDPKF